MLQEAKDLQQRKIAELFTKAHGEEKVLTFRAPTGSGKTWMMADFMNRIIAEQKDVVFIVSTLSKGNLAQQNYDSFVKNVENGTFPLLKPYLINSEVSGEEEIYIPTDYNVYVLPRDLYKEGSILKRGAMQHFLLDMTNGVFKMGLGKKIYLIKDECHVATSNLDEESKKGFFARTFNFSATPKLSRGQKPDIEMTNEEAIKAHLIKDIELNEDINATVDEALEKFLDVKKQYDNLLDVHPCLIIQISNKDKAEEEWNQKIKPALDKHQSLKWMLIVDAYKNTGEEDKKKYLQCDTNDDVKKKLHPSKWKEYAKGRHSTIDVVIFKMVISEGWDIPRACMLFQVRDTTSQQLDEQVVGRVQRNPRLLDYESLSPEAQELASTAWVWGLRPKGVKRSIPVRLWKVGNESVRSQIMVRTTKLELTEREIFDEKKFMEGQREPTTYKDIFTHYQKLLQGDNAISNLCYKYAGGDYIKWWRFMEVYDKVRKQYDNFKINYEKSMVKREGETSFPITSTYLESENNDEIEDWIWCRHENDSYSFSFDSDAEREWAGFLAKMALKGGVAEVAQLDENERFLWGKNFPQNSDINYEYYSNGIHKSYPDFVMKDKRGRIHVFEVKCLNGSGKAGFKADEYEEKIVRLKECYLWCSKILKDHIFHIPIKEGDKWQILTYDNGEEDSLRKDRFLNTLK